MPSSTITTTFTVPAESNVYGAKLSFSMPVNASDASPNPAPQQEPPKTPAKQISVRYAAAVLTGQMDLLENIAPSFTGADGTIRQDDDKWILESPRFQSCTTGEQLFSLADDILGEIQSILAVYINSISFFSVDYVRFFTRDGAEFRQIHASGEINVVSTKGIAELKTLTGTQPVGSVVLEAINNDPAIREAFSLHGEGALSWSQIYDVIEFVGGEKGIVKAKLATSKAVHRVRQTANHHRHLGNPRKYPLPPKPVSLNEGTQFARNLLKSWIAKRLGYRS